MVRFQTLHSQLLVSHALIFRIRSEKFPGSFVDLEAGIATDAVDEASGQSLWDDNLHFSPFGYDRMADLIFDVIKPKFENRQISSSSST